MPTATPKAAAAGTVPAPANDTKAVDARAGKNNENVRVPAERLDELMDRVGELVIAQSRLTLESVSKAADSLAATSDSANQLLNSDGKSLAKDLRETLKQARASLESLDATVKEAQPGVASFSKDTMPQVALLVRDLRQMSQSLKTVTDKLDQEGAGSLIGSPRLPDYKK